jgi:hypothetical protein
MRALRLGGTALVAVVAVLLPAPAASAADASQMSVTLDRARVSTQLGQKFSFRSTITNRGSTPASGLIAHLNVLSLRPGVYVDPEDWSAERTRYLGTIPPGGSTTTTWRVHAVNHGTLGVYVAVLDESGRARPPRTGPTLRLAVAERKTLNSGGILPLALGVPGLLGVGTLALRWYRRGQ